MPNYIGNKNDVVSRGLKTLTTQTNIRQMARGGKARSIVETVGQEVENLSNLSDLDSKRVLLPTSYGKFLDNWGVTVGKGKLSERTAEVLAEDRVIKFYPRLGGTFGSINDNTTFIIPVGTIITAPQEVAQEAANIMSGIDEADSTFDRSIHYAVTQAVVCEYTASEAWVSAKALTPGRGGNLAAPGMLRTHSFEDYDNYLIKGLAVTNTQPILNGIEIESEASYKYRISKTITEAERANHTAIRLAALGVPGVADVMIMPFEDGAGRFNVYIKSISSVVSDTTVWAVQDAIDSVESCGNIGYARRPYEVGIEIRSTVTFRENYKESVKDEIRENLRIGALSYLNSMDMGSPINIQNMASDLKMIDGRVSLLGSNKTTEFDAIYIYYPARLADNGRRREKLLQGTIEVPAHTRIIAETSIDEPVRFF